MGRSQKAKSGAVAVIEKAPFTSSQLPEILKTPEWVADLIELRNQGVEIENMGNSPKYLYWDSLKHRSQSGTITPFKFWRLVKVLRIINPDRQTTVVHDKHGKGFSWLPLSRFQELLHELDKSFAGSLKISGDSEPNTRREFVSRGIMEEAIASSQLEGASTTRAHAQQMLREKRKARNSSEQMILNNYTVMNDIEESLRHEKLSLEKLQIIHRKLTEKTLDNKEDEGRFRNDEDNIVVAGDDQILHIPPNREILDSELQKLIAYANDELKDNKFTHPVIKAIMLHFWIGYLHPFVDGNGRLARAIFYWYLLRKDYWAISYAPISKCIIKAPVQYRNAYLYSEQDDNDLTYFIDYNLSKIREALNLFERHIRNVMHENQELEKRLSSDPSLNKRQLQLLRDMKQDPNLQMTAQTYCKVFNVSNPTSLSELADLAKKGYLSRTLEGRSKPYRATEKARQLFRR